MKATYWQKGETKDYKNGGSTLIEAGTVIALKNRIGVAGTNIAVGETGSLHVTGVYEMAKKTGEAVLDGQMLYYDTTNSVVTTTEGDIVAGCAFQGKTSADTIILVKID